MFLNARLKSGEQNSFSPTIPQIKFLWTSFLSNVSETSHVRRVKHAPVIFHAQTFSSAIRRNRSHVPFWKILSRTGRGGLLIWDFTFPVNLGSSHGPVITDLRSGYRHAARIAELINGYLTLCYWFRQVDAAHSCGDTDECSCAGHG